MGDKEYIDEIRDYYSSNYISILSSNSPGLISCNNNFPDGKTKRRENRRRAIRKRKGRL